MQLLEQLLAGGDALPLAVKRLPFLARLHVAVVDDFQDGLQQLLLEVAELAELYFVQIKRGHRVLYPRGVCPGPLEQLLHLGGLGRLEERPRG